MKRMNIALCFESIMPARGGCETYIAGLARRLAADGHSVHLYACHWDRAALPSDVQFHAIPSVRSPRFLRPWFFGAACLKAARDQGHDVSVGFDKTWGQDVLYPQGGLHAAAARHNLLKYPSRVARGLAAVGKSLDVAYWSFLLLERQQYLGQNRPAIIVNSEMVQGHFEKFYGIPPAAVRVIPSAIDPRPFVEHDRPRRRVEWREQWGIGANEVAGLFVAVNYRLKGLEPLLYAVRLMRDVSYFKLLVAGGARTGGYERLANRLGIADRVLFLGPRRDVNNCYFAADFMVHPTFYDPCSLVVLEALACGLPVITSRFNGASELLHPPHDGYVIRDPHDHHQLADCMSQLLDPVVRQAAAKAARQTAQHTGFEAHYQQMLQVFAEVAERKRAA
jgi:UDP-glucose:(heptosyl)LPS alpha-1,3-glucosyltransferase